ncbi:hypothetical protein N7481_002325 [Penicillium waksmanii]|uniref:uncharacterized protein n=1 Tax=Penicillium waksmanii TaxID=69791 RepID=UPI0025488F68|nr:uncharacterized protein N7481_002325 [Penicillium waksmanii]KAJ5995348.1 hypothetical protein N7481_002325 [Penicillium waksmanii]
MCSSNMGHQAARAQEEGTTEMETRSSFAPHQTSQTSHPSNSSPPTSHPTMFSGNADSSQANSRSHREAQSSESGSSSKSATSIWSSKATSPKTSTAQSPASSLLSSKPESIDLGVDTITLLTAHILDRPSSLDQLCNYLDVLKKELLSEDPPSSQYLLVRRIPDDLFLALVEDPEVPKGVRVTILHHEHEILYKIIPYHYHEKISRQFDTWINDALGKMGLSFLNYDFWLGGGWTVDWSRVQQGGRHSVFPWKGTGRRGTHTMALSCARGRPIRVRPSATDGCPLVVLQLGSPNPACGPYLRQS